MAPGGTTSAELPCGHHPYGCATETCKRVHHKNLYPSLAEDNQSDGGYMLSNETNVACQRCLQQALPCDKKGRGGSNDPCSECRHFGGVGCECELSESSYNDALWAVMLVRAGQDYTLPPFKPRDQPRPKKGPPLPMRDDRVKADWEGETREQLLAKVDMLPAGVRPLPRAHLVPPRETSRQKSFAAMNERAEKRTFDGDFSQGFPPPAAVSYPAIPPMPAPAWLPQQLPPPPTPSSAFGASISDTYTETTWTYNAGTSQNSALQTAHPGASAQPGQTYGLPARPAFALPPGPSGGLPPLPRDSASEERKPWHRPAVAPPEKKQKSNPDAESSAPETKDGAEKFKGGGM